MRKRFYFGLSAALLLVAGAMFFASDDRNAYDRGSRVQTEDNAPRKSNSKPGNSNRIMMINSLEANDSIKKRLDSSSHILKIHHNERDKSHFHQHQATVKFTVHPSNSEIKRMNSDIGGQLINNTNSVLIFKSENKTTQELIDYFKQQPNVEYAEPNYILLQNQDLPNDYFYSEYQWNLPMIETEAGWDLTRGSKKVTIAVVDTGVDLDHRDLKGRLVKGYNVLEDNSRPDDDNGHGTHVAGIIASKTNNREGVAGITWYNKIMPIKAMAGDGTGSSFDIAKGIIWAADHGADVINMSLGNYQPSTALNEAIKYAYDKNVVLIAATGNDNTDQPSYPAAFKEVLSVAAVSPDGTRAPFSNYGDYVDVAAPGVNIASTYPDQQYAALSGTSMATPHVAALAGLIKSIDPDLTNKEVVKIIKKSSVDLGDKGSDRYFGSGMIDIVNALKKTEKQANRD